ncbi:cytochrome P450 4d1-like [Chironomus tepperi]|uniref:cytochrome P450 4d1-like n=1 Tax=Chironomus tepperi TaxID=113505 RepID=UPI00391FB627
MYFVIFFIVAVAAFIIWYQIKYRRQNYLLSKIPGPRKLPIFHHLIDFIGKDAKGVFDYLEIQGEKFSPVFHLTVSPFDPGSAIVSDVKIIEALLTSQVHIEKTIDYDLLVPWIGNGLITSSGKKWFQRRKLITPGFHFQILEKFVDIMNEHSKVFIKQLEKYDGKFVDIFPLVNLYALDTICEAVMGINIHAQTTNSEYLRAVKEVTTIAMIRSLDETKRNKFLFQFTDMYKRQQKCIKILHEFTDDVIQRRREDLLNANEVDDTGKKKKKALLDILLSSSIDGQPLSNLDIREEVDTFAFAGHDTTSSAISFTFYNIAKYPEVQQKVYDEIIEVIGYDEELTIQKLNNLYYLDLVVKESLRLFPPAPYYGRKLSEELTAGGYTFPKNMKIYVSPYLLRKNPDIYPEPEKFNPHRFEAERFSDKVNSFSYIPFSAGSRNCIGQKFALYEIKVIISTVLRHFKLTFDKKQENLKLTAEIILRPVDGINIFVEKRT